MPIGDLTKSLAHSGTNILMQVNEERWAGNIFLNSISNSLLMINVVYCIYGKHTVITQNLMI
jgi:hypothetical protein